MTSLKLAHLVSSRIPALTRQLEGYLSRMSLARKPRAPGAPSGRGEPGAAPAETAPTRGAVTCRAPVPAAAVRRELFARDLVGEAIGEALCDVAAQMGAEDGGAWAVDYFEFIARRRLIDLARREAFRLAHHEAPSRDENGGWTEPLARAANDDADPETRLQAREALAATVAALGALPEGSRALLLGLAQGLDYDDLAPHFQTTAGALRVRAHGLRKRLRAAVRSETDLPAAG